MKKVKEQQSNRKQKDNIKMNNKIVHLSTTTNNYIKIEQIYKQNKHSNKKQTLIKGNKMSDPTRHSLKLNNYKGFVTFFFDL